MRPVLEAKHSTIAIAQAQEPDAAPVAPDAFEHDPEIWNPGQNRKNPWKPEMDQIMFYI